MAKASYAVVGGKTKKIKKKYAVVNGVAKKVKKMYAVIGGKTKLFWQSTMKEWVVISSENNRILKSENLSDTTIANFLPQPTRARYVTSTYSFGKNAYIGYVSSGHIDVWSSEDGITWERSIISLPNYYYQASMPIVKAPDGYVYGISNELQITSSMRMYKTNNFNTWQMVSVDLGNIAECEDVVDIEYGTYNGNTGFVFSTKNAIWEITNISGNTCTANRIIVEYSNYPKNLYIYNNVLYYFIFRQSNIIINWTNNTSWSITSINGEIAALCKTDRGVMFITKSNEVWFFNGSGSNNVIKKTNFPFSIKILVDYNYQQSNAICAYDVNTTTISVAGADRMAYTRDFGNTWNVMTYGETIASVYNYSTTLHLTVEGGGKY